MTAKRGRKKGMTEAELLRDAIEGLRSKGDHGSVAQLEAAADAADASTAEASAEREHSSRDALRRLAGSIRPGRTGSPTDQEGPGGGAARAAP